uniref:Uncharacterized protein n=1 Tax=Arundo donax TaxID=35708 RepID=A0A0A9FZ74_ARUDO
MIMVSTQHWTRNMRSCYNIMVRPQIFSRITNMDCN